MQKRYDDLGHCTRYYRHIQMLKRAGRAHIPNGVEQTPPGGLALQCPACPHPEINLPPDWAECADKLCVVFQLLFLQRLTEMNMEVDVYVVSGH